MVKKALILSGGTGRRFFPLTQKLPKQILPVMGKPIIFYGIESMVSAGMEEIFIIIGKNGRKVIETVGNGKKWGVKIEYIKQNKPLGLAHAVKISRNYFDRSSFLMWLGDTIIREKFSEIIKCYERRNANALILLGKTTKPSICGIAEVKMGKVIKVKEKPKYSSSNLAIAGLYIFDVNIFNAVENITPSLRGELEITDAIQYLINENYSVIPYITKKTWIDIGNPESYILANILLMKEIKKGK